MNRKIIFSTVFCIFAPFSTASADAEKALTYGLVTAVVLGGIAYSLEDDKNCDGLGSAAIEAQCKDDIEDEKREAAVFVAN